jgi:meiosis-specific APC/C activator protein AMA1
MGQWTNSVAYLTSLSFSSAEGGLALLAIGRIDGQITLWSLFDIQPRFEAQQPAPIACLAWKPRTTPRQTQRSVESPEIVATEELLVGDEVGNVYYYSVEWANTYRLGPDTWPGSMILLARITVHTQQICGLAWSPDGEFFATGGNDNACCLFEAKNLLRRPDLGREQDGEISEEPVIGINGVRSGFMVQPGRGTTCFIGPGREKHKWAHGAAVKAIAFCPWQRGLIATGGGSNDRCIHFYHTFSGACLATISVAAQVTSLIWSTTRREIAATFGYASPDHPYRIAVFSWPDCRQVVSIPWASEMRALYAIAYPGGPNETNTRKTGSGSRTAEEGCIVIASSDESVKFHEVWSDAKGTVGGNKGMLGGSDILESLEGIDKEGNETIR